MFFFSTIKALKVGARIMNSSQERVNRQIFYMMVGSFILVTLINFQSFFIGIIRYFCLLPSWWLLIVLPLFGMAVVYSINRGEYEIKMAEEELLGKQQRIIEIERQFRLIKSDLFTLSPIQFTYYCADLLRALGYQEVKVHTKQCRIRGINPDGEQLCVFCIHIVEKLQLDEQLIELLKDRLVDEGIEKGLIMTTSDFTSDALACAKQNEMECYNGAAISKLVWLAVEEYKEKAQ